MKLTTLGTIIASIVLSIVATLLIVPRPVAGSSDTIRGRQIELTDAKGRTRLKMSAATIDGYERPEITMLGADGRPSVVLSVNQRGEGTLYFSSPEKEGKVALGYVWGSDVQPKSLEDPLALWGLRVLGRNGQAQSIGIGNDGHSVVPTK
jgi:hypothetical protein